MIPLDRQSLFVSVWTILLTDRNESLKTSGLITPEIDFLQVSYIGEVLGSVIWRCFGLLSQSPKPPVGYRPESRAGDATA